MWRKLGVFFVIMAIFISLLVLLPIVTSWGIKFEDPRLEAAIKSAVGKRDVSYIRLTWSDLSKIHHLNISGRNIQSLDGIDLLTKLVTLDASNNKIKSVAPLAKVTNLKGLDLSNNGISDLEDIEFDTILHLPLTNLNLSDNASWFLGKPIERLDDVSIIGHFAELKELSLNNLAIEDYRFIANFTELKVLEIEGAHVSNIDFISNLTKLEEVNLRSSTVTDISPLADLGNLRYLNLHSCTDITNLEVLGTLDDLDTLIIPNVDLSESISIFVTLDSLKRLNIRNTGVDTLDFLEGNPSISSLVEIDIRENPIPSPTLEHDPYNAVRSRWKVIPYAYPHTLPGFSISPPRFSHPGGMYGSPFYLSLESATDGTIYYTVDGSIPDPKNIMSDETWNSLPRETKERTYRYTQPIDLSSLVDRPNDIAMIPTGVPGLVDSYYSSIVPKNPVDKIAVVRALSAIDGKLSDPVTQSYVIEGNGSGNRLPTVSIAIPRAYLFDFRDGIYVAGENYRQGENGSGNYYLKGRTTSRFANFELVDGETEMFNSPVTVRIHGNWSRRYPQKSLRILFNEDSGNDPIEYPFFKESDEISYNTLILRNAGSDWGEGMMRDVVSQEMVRHLSIDMQEYLPVQVYINGEFWGVHNLRERQDEFYFRNKYGLPIEDITMLEANGNVAFGNMHSSKQFFDLVNRADSLSLDELSSMIDIPNFISYNILQLYSSNTDWPHNNIQYWRYEGDIISPEWGPFDGRWRWILQDLDHSFGYIEGPQFDMISHMFSEEDAKFSLNRNLLISLLEHQSIFNTFIQEIAMHLNTTFRSDRVLKVLHDHIEKISYIMPAQYERWGYPSEEQWNEELALMLDYAEKRPTFMLQQVVEFFPEVTGIAQLTIAGLSGHEDIYIESIGINDSTPTIEIGIETWTGDFFAGIPLTISSRHTRLDEILLASDNQVDGTYTIIYESPNKIILTLTPESDILMDL